MEDAFSRGDDLTAAAELGAPVALGGDGRGALVFAGRFGARRQMRWADVMRACSTPMRRAVLDCGGAHDRPVAVFPLGGITAIMGPSGAGKTTLMRMASGRAFGRGVDVVGLWIAPSATRPGDAPSAPWRSVAPAVMRRGSAFVDQDDGALDPAATPRSLIRFYVDALHRARVPRADERGTLVEGALADARLTGAAADTACGRLSGGQRKRASIAVQLARGRSLVFMDEPTSGLDSAASEAVFDAVVRTNRRRGTTVVMVVHHPSERMLGGVQRVMLVAAGVIVYQGPPGGAAAFVAAAVLCAPQMDLTAVDAVKDAVVRDDGDSEGDDNQEEADDPERASAGDRLVACVSQGRDEGDHSYQARMRALAAQGAPLCGDRAVLPPEDSRSDDEKDVTRKDEDDDGCKRATTAATVLGLDRDRAPLPRGRRTAAAALCAWRLAVRGARHAIAPAAIAQALFKYVALPLLIVISLADAVRGAGQDAVAGAHAAAALAIMWTGMDAAWEVVMLLPALDRQYVKHHEDGLYGAATHLLAAHAGDSMARIPLLTVFAAIVYFGVGLRTDGASGFLVFWTAVVLTALVARSLCFACTCWLRPDRGVLLLSLAMAMAVVIGGVYMPLGIMPGYARGLAYASFMTYGVSIVVRNEFAGRAYACDANCCAYPTGDAAIADYAAKGAPVWLCFVVLVAGAALLTGLAWGLLVMRARRWRRV